MSKSITATKVKDLDGFTGQAALYKLSEPVKYGWDDGDENELPSTDHIVVSAATVMFSGPETYIFPADESGEIVNWLEMEGSLKGVLSHEAALRSAGFEVAA